MDVRKDEMITERQNEEILIGEEERIRHDALFYSQSPDDGLLLSGERARSLFIKSKLPLPDLSKIWKLSDITRDNMLDEGEFVVALHLIQRRLCGCEIPESIPTPLRPKSRPLLVIAQANENEIEAYSHIFDWLRQQDEEFLCNEDVLRLLSKSNVSIDVLAKIWDLSDIDRDGRINKDELYIAIHLTRFCKNSSSDLSGSIDVLSILPKKSAEESIQEKRRRRTEYQTEIRKLTSLRYKLKSELLNAKTSGNMAAKKKIQCELDVVTRELDAMEEKESAVRDEIYKMNTATIITTNIEVLRPFDRSFLMKKQSSGAEFLKEMKFNTGANDKFAGIQEDIFIGNNIIEFALKLARNQNVKQKNQDLKTKDKIETVVTPEKHVLVDYSSDDESETVDVGTRRRKRSKQRIKPDIIRKDISSPVTSDKNSLDLEKTSRRVKNKSATKTGLDMEKRLSKSSSQSENEQKEDVARKDSKEIRTKESVRKRSSNALEIFQKLFSSDSESSSEKEGLSPSKTNSKKGQALQKSPWREKKSFPNKITTDDSLEEENDDTLNIESVEKSPIKNGNEQKGKSQNKFEWMQRMTSPEPEESENKIDGSKTEVEEVLRTERNSKKPESQLINSVDVGVSVNDRTKGSFLRMQEEKRSDLKTHIGKDGNTVNSRIDTKENSVIISNGETKMHDAEDDEFVMRKIQENPHNSKKEIEEDNARSKKEVKKVNPLSKKEVREDDLRSKKEVKKDEMFSKKEIKEPQIPYKDSVGVEHSSIDFIDMLEESLIDSEGDLKGRETSGEEVEEDEITDCVVQHEESAPGFDLLDLLDETNFDSKDGNSHKNASAKMKTDQSKDAEEDSKDELRTLGVLRLEEVMVTTGTSDEDRPVRQDGAKKPGDRRERYALVNETAVEEEIRPRQFQNGSRFDNEVEGTRTVAPRDGKGSSATGEKLSEEKIRPRQFQNVSHSDDSKSFDSETFISSEADTSDDGKRFSEERPSEESPEEAKGQIKKKTKKVLKTKSGHVVRTRSLYGLRSTLEPDRLSYVEECEWLDGLVVAELEAAKKKKMAEPTVLDSPWKVTDPYYETQVNSRKYPIEYSRSETIDERALNLDDSRTLVRGLLDMEIAQRNEQDTTVQLRDKGTKRVRDEEFLARRRSMPVGKEVLRAAEVVEMLDSQRSKAAGEKQSAEEEAASTENTSRDISNAQGRTMRSPDSRISDEKLQDVGIVSQKGDFKVTNKDESNKKVSKIDSTVSKDDKAEKRNSLEESKPLKSINVFKEMFESATTARPVDKYKSASFDMKPRSAELTRSKSLGDGLTRPRKDSDHIHVFEKQTSVDISARDEKVLADENMSVGKAAKANETFSERRAKYKVENSFSKEVQLANEEDFERGIKKESGKISTKEASRDSVHFSLSETKAKLEKLSPKHTVLQADKTSTTDTHEKQNNVEIVAKQKTSKVKDSSFEQPKEEVSVASREQDEESKNTDEDRTVLRSIGEFKQLFENKPTNNTKEVTNQKRSLAKSKSEVIASTEGETIVKNDKKIQQRSQSVKHPPKKMEHKAAELESKERYKDDKSEVLLSREGDAFVKNDKKIQQRSQSLKHAPKKIEHTATEFGSKERYKDDEKRFSNDFRVPEGGKASQTSPQRIVDERNSEHRDKIAQEQVELARDTPDQNNNSLGDEEHIPSIKDRLALFQAETAGGREPVKTEGRIRKDRPKSFHGKSILENGAKEHTEVKDIDVRNYEGLAEDDGFTRVGAERKPCDKNENSLSKLGEMMLGGGSDSAKISKSPVAKNAGRKIVENSLVSPKFEHKSQPENAKLNEVDDNLYRRIAKDDRIRKELEEQEERDQEIRRRMQTMEQDLIKKDIEATTQSRPVIAQSETKDDSKSLLKNKENSKLVKDERPTKSSADIPHSQPDYRSLVTNDRVRKEIEEQERRENELKKRNSQEINLINSAEKSETKTRKSVANKQELPDKLGSSKPDELANQKSAKPADTTGTTNQKSPQGITKEGRPPSLKAKKIPSKIELELEEERKRELELVNERKRRQEEQNQVFEEERKRLEMIEAEKMKIAEDREAEKTVIVEEKMKRQARTRGLRAMFETA